MTMTFAIKVHGKVATLVVVSTPLKNIKVSWDDSSQYMESQQIHVPNHQPEHVAETCTTRRLPMKIEAWLAYDKTAWYILV
jgi:hypothetical protein